LNKPGWIIILFALLTVLAIPSCVDTKTQVYFVSKTGSDTNDGSLANPWLTIQHAADTMIAGSTVYIESGTYNERVYITTHSGTTGNPITFSNYPGDSPIIDGTGLPKPTHGDSLVMITKSYINFEGFEITNNPYDDGVYVFNGSHINLSELKIHDTAMCGIKLQGTASFILIDSCELYNCNTNLNNETVSLMPAHDIEIKNNHIHHTNKAGIDCKGDNGIAGTYNVSIHDNEINNIFNDQQGIYIDLQAENQDGFFIYSNKIHDNYWGIVLASEVSPATLTNVNIYNNLFYNNGTAFAVWPYSFPKTVNIINNTFHNNSFGLYWADTSAQYQVNCVVRNNIFSRSTSTHISYNYYPWGEVTTDHNLFYDGDTVYGTNYIQADPLFISPDTGNFNIAENSPAIDAGSVTDAPTTDYIGTTRPSGAAVDIGAYEYSIPLHTQ
jgi:hypothetical protein